MGAHVNDNISISKTLCVFRHDSSVAEAAKECERGRGAETAANQRERGRVGDEVGVRLGGEQRFGRGLDGGGAGGARERRGGGGQGGGRQTDVVKALGVQRVQSGVA